MLHKKFICFDDDMDFSFDDNMIAAIAMINKRMHLVKLLLYHVILTDCEQNG